MISFLFLSGCGEKDPNEVLYKNHAKCLDEVNKTYGTEISQFKVEHMKSCMNNKGHRYDENRFSCYAYDIGGKLPQPLTTSCYRFKNE